MYVCMYIHTVTHTHRNSSLPAKSRLNEPREKEREREKLVSFDSDMVGIRRRQHNDAMLRRFTQTFLITAILFLALINRVTPRSLKPDNLTVDRSEVPARYVFEIDEVQDELSEMDITRPSSDHGNSNSGLRFNMPIALAVFAAVMFLVCCFCCLRCAVTYDEIKRSGFYGGSEKSNVVDIVRRFKTNEKPITVKN